MNLILIGLFFILFRYDYSFFSQNIEMEVVIDVLPDFVGYLLIWFGLEKAATSNRWYKESHNIATAMLVVSFLTLMATMSFLLNPLLQSPDGQTFLIAFSLITLVVQNAGSIIAALTMIFIFMFSSALGFSMQTLDKYVLSYIMKIFSVVYAVFAVTYAVDQFINLPFEIWWFSYPVSALFLVFAYFIMGKTEELR